MRKTFLTILAAFALLWGAWNLPLLLSMFHTYTASSAAPPTWASGSTAQAAGPGEDELSYPRLGIQAPVGSLANASPTDIAEWSGIRKQLAKGTSLTYGTNTFEEAPRAFLTGHSSDTYPHPYSAVFAPLYRAQPGDDIYVRLEGKAYHYSVVRVDKVAPGNVAYFAAPHREGVDARSQELDLVTCWPILTTQQRLVVIAQRVP